MGFGAVRSITRPVSQSFLSSRVTPSPIHFPITSSTSPACDRIFSHHLLKPFIRNVSGTPAKSMVAFNSFLTDTKFPKRRPDLNTPRPKRITLRPPGPYVWVKTTPDEPIAEKQPNQGSVKRRNEKKRIKLHRAFIKSERKKRVAQVQEANRKKLIKRQERKMAQVARERAWAERLVELQKIEEEKKKAAAAATA